MVASSSAKVPSVEHIHSSVALRRCINDEIAKYKTPEGRSVIDGRIFISRHHAHGEYVLGHIFNEAPAALPPLYPHLEDHYLLYKRKLNWGG